MFIQAQLLDIAQVSEETTVIGIYNISRTAKKWFRKSVQNLYCIYVNYTDNYEVEIYRSENREERDYIMRELWNAVIAECTHISIPELIETLEKERDQGWNI